MNKWCMSDDIWLNYCYVWIQDRRLSCELLTKYGWITAILGSKIDELVTNLWWIIDELLLFWNPRLRNQWWMSDILFGSSWILAGPFWESKGTLGGHKGIQGVPGMTQGEPKGRLPAFSLFGYPSADIMHELRVAIWCVRQRRVPFVKDGSGFDACQIRFRHQSHETSLIRAAHNLAHSPGPLHVPVVFAF